MSTTENLFLTGDLGIVSDLPSEQENPTESLTEQEKAIRSLEEAEKEILLFIEILDNKVKFDFVRLNLENLKGELTGMLELMGKNYLAIVNFAKKIPMCKTFSLYTILQQSLN